MAGGTQALSIPGSEYAGAVEVQHQIFAADDGYAVIEARDEASGNLITVIGPVGHLEAGERAEIRGSWTEHATYGPQVKASSAAPLDPEDRKGQVAFLTTLKHIGRARAESLVDTYGASVMDAIAKDPVGTFTKLRGLSAAKAESAAESWYASRAIRDLHVALAPHGLAHLASRLHSRYGDEALGVLHSDPYRLIEVDGVGFARADQIAIANDVPPESERRAQAAAYHVIAEAERDGSTFLPGRSFEGRISKLLGYTPDPDALARARGVSVEDERWYRSTTLERETRCAEMLGARISAEARFNELPELDGPHSESLTAEQLEAVRGAFQSRISIVTGGPGVGKTECTREIVGAAQRLHAGIALCAPTGRAAHRLQEATGHEAKTIHRMLEWRPGSEPTYRPNHPLPVELVIVDEASMLNLQLIEVLLGGLAESTHIVFVGDADQLPPVGAGKPFSDMIETGLAPVTRLTHIFRQAARSMITTAAHSINRGAMPALEPGPDQQRDFSLLERASPGSLVEQVESLVAERVPEGLGLDPMRDVQVLAPMYRPPIGIDTLNERLQARVNPDGEPACNDRFRKGDRLIQTRNAHELGLMNGSICFLIDDDPEEQEIVLETDDGSELVMGYDDADTLRLAYAISVHKSQGCEVPVVIFVCHTMHAHMLTRPLVYTAVTRARSHCVVVGTHAALDSAVHRDDGGRRHSGLPDRLRQAASSRWG